MKQALKTALRDWLDARGIELRRNDTVDPLRLIRRLLSEPEPVIFDVGAHVGLTCVQYRRAFPDARIYAFEPFPASFERLGSAVQGDARTHLHALALSDVAGSAPLRVNRSEATNSLLPVAREAHQAWGEGLLESAGTVVTDTDTIDAFCRAEGLDRIGLLKLDVQGAEYAVLSGASSMLGAQCIGLVYTEIILVSTYAGQRSLQDYLHLMAGHGYQMVDIYNPIRRRGRLLQADFIFASEAMLANPVLNAT